MARESREMRRRDPMLEVFAPMRAFGRMWDDWLGESGPDGGRLLRPAMDVSESEDKLTLSVDLPGLKKEDVQITVEGNVVSISGEKKFESEETGKDRAWHRIERGYGRFHRSVTLPPGVDTSQVDARFEDGVLTVEFAKSEAAKPKRIQVR